MRRSFVGVSEVCDFEIYLAPRVTSPSICKQSRKNRLSNQPISPVTLAVRIVFWTKLSPLGNLVPKAKVRLVNQTSLDKPIGLQ